MLVLAGMGVGKDAEVRVGLSVPGPGSLEVGLGCRPCLTRVSRFEWFSLAVPFQVAIRLWWSETEFALLERLQGTCTVHGYGSS